VHTVVNPPTDTLVTVTNDTGEADFLFFRLAVPAPTP